MVQVRSPPPAVIKVAYNLCPQTQLALVLSINFCDNMWCDLSWLSAPVTCCSNMLPQLFPTINHNLEIFCDFGCMVYLWSGWRTRIGWWSMQAITAWWTSFQWKAWPGHLSLDYPWRTGGQNWGGGLVCLFGWWLCLIFLYLVIFICNCWYQVHCIAITILGREKCPGQISLDHPWWWGDEGES